MDPLLLKYYDRELHFIREMGAEFAAEFPKIAGRLGMDGVECADPYVERLLEGFAFLAARVQLRIDAEYPRLTQNLLEIVYPHYLTPTPAMAVVQLQPLASGDFESGSTIPRNTALRSVLGKGEQTACEFRTAHEVSLWPLAIAEVEYISNMGPIVGQGMPGGIKPKAGLRLRLRTTGGQPIRDIQAERLQVFLRGRDGQAMSLYEQLLGNSAGLLLRPVERPLPWTELISADHIRPCGFADDQALIPRDGRSFSGYRLLQEYFAFPDRFMFVEFAGLQQAFRRCAGTEIELIALFDRYDAALESTVSEGDLALHCTPVINLFPKRADRIHLSDSTSDYHLVPDRTRPLDFEVFSVQGVVGHGTSAEQQQTFLPFYACEDTSRFPEHAAYYSLRRERRLISSQQRRQGPRSSYIGSECFISLVDTSEAPYAHALKQLEAQTLCTNRDLPLQMPVGKGKSDFSLEVSAPVEAVRCIRGPTRPRPSLAHQQGEVAWRLVNHLSLNYLSLLDSDGEKGAAALRELLTLYSDSSDPALRKQIEGIKSIRSEQVTRRIPIPGPIAFGRGLQITLTMEESAFVGSGVFLLGAVLDHFFARYVSINSFTETVLQTIDRGEVMRWPVRIGQRQIV